MKDIRTVVVVGAGLAGVSCALALKTLRPAWRVRVAEMAEQCLPGFRRMAPFPAPASAESDDFLLESVFRGREAARHLFFRFDGEAYRRALADWPRTDAGRIDPLRAATFLEQRLVASDIEWVPGRKASQVSPRGGDGLFRIWFDVGNPWEADHLVLAMGGTRHRGFGWTEEWGHRIRPNFPAFLALRLSESRWRSLIKVRWSGVTVSWQNPANAEHVTATGDVDWRFPFLEGPVIAAVTARAGDALRAVGTAGRLEIFLPDLKHRGLHFVALQQKVQQGGSRPVANDPPADFHPAAWSAIVRGARIGDEESWSRLSRRQVQTLASHLSQLTVKFSGSRQWRDEFAVQGGLDPDQFHAGTLESRCVDGLHVIGEMLDIDGAPGGTNLHLAIAAGAAAAQGIAASPAA